MLSLPRSGTSSRQEPPEQSFPQVVSTLLGALKGGEMGSHYEEGFPAGTEWDPQDRRCHMMLCS